MRTPNQKTARLSTMMTRVVALALSLAVAGADGSWAAATQSLFNHSGFTIPVGLNSPFPTQALQPLVKAAFRQPQDSIASQICRGASARHVQSARAPRLQMGFLQRLFVPLLISVSLFGQKTEIQPPADTPAIQELIREMPPDVPLPAVRELISDNKVIAQRAITDDVWTLNVPIPEHIDQLDDFIEPLIDHNPDLYAQWLQNQSLTEDWLAQMSRDTILAITSDPNRAPEVPLFPSKGSSVYSTLAGMTFFPRFEDRNALQRVESFNSKSDNGHESLWPRIWRNVEALFIGGGIQGTSKNIIAKHALQIVLKGTALRVDYADFLDLGQQKAFDFNQTLYRLLKTQAALERKDLQIRLTEKELADWSSHQESNVEEIQQKRVGLKLDRARLIDERAGLEKERGNLEDRLHRLFGGSNAQTVFAPRPPHVELSRHLLETLANDPDLKVSADLERRLRDGLKRRLHLLASTGHRVPDSALRAVDQVSVFDPAFLAILLNQAWTVRGYDGLVVLPESATNPRRTIVADLPDGADPRLYVPAQNLLTILPNDDSLVGVSGHEDSLILQGRQLMTANDLLERDKHSEFNWALRWTWTGIPGLPIRAEMNYKKPLDTERTNHELTSNEILQARVQTLLKAYRNDTLMERWQEIRRQQIEDVSRAGATARLLLDLYRELANALNPPALNERSKRSAAPVIDVQTAAENIAMATLSLQSNLTDLLGDADQADLMGKGLDRINDDLSTHVVRSMKGLNELLPEPDVAPTAPPLTNDKPAKASPTNKKNKKSHGMPAKASLLKGLSSIGPFVALSVLGLGFAGDLSAATLNQILPHAHYWTNPLLQGGSALSVILTMAGLGFYFRNGFTSVLRSPWRFLVTHASLAVLLALWVPGSLWFSVAFATGILLFVRLTLPWMHDSYPVNLKPWSFYRYIHWMNAREERSAAVFGTGFAGIVITLLAMIYQPASHKLTELYESFSNEPSTVRTTSEKLYMSVETGAPFGETGRVINDPTQSNRLKVSAGQAVLFWRSPQDGQLLNQIKSLNDQLTGLGSSISGGEVLNTGDGSDFKRALVQVQAQGEADAGSIEGRLQSVLTEIEQIIPLASQAAAVGRNNRAIVGGTSSSLEELYHIELTALTEAASALLEQRAVRNIRATKPFTFVASTSQLGNGATIDSGKPVTLGTRAIDDAVRFQLIMTESEALTLESFSHQPKAVAIVDDEDGQHYYFRASDILKIGEPADQKGLFSDIYTLPNSGPLSRLRLSIRVLLPDGQTAPRQAGVFTFKGFYRDDAVSRPGHIEPRDDQRLSAETVNAHSTDKVAVLEIDPTGQTYLRTAPPAALSNEIAAYENAIARFKALENRKEGDQALAFSRADAAFGREDRSIAQACADRIAVLSRQLAAAQSRRSLWDAGAFSTRILSNHPGNALAGKIYPEDELAAVRDPLEHKFPVPGALSDSYYTFGPNTRVKLTVSVTDFQSLAVHKGESITVFVPGSNQTFVMTDVDTINLRELEMTSAKAVIYGTVKTEDLPAIFPGILSGHGPVGAAIVRISKTHLGATLKIETPPTKAIPKPVSMYLGALLVGLPFMPLPPILKQHLIVGGVLGSIVLASMIAGILAVRAAQRQMERRRQMRDLQPVVAKGRVTVAAGEPIIYAANGLFPPKSHFMQLIGAGEINEGTINAARRTGSLRTVWDFPDKLSVSVGLERAIDRIDDVSILQKMASHLRVSTLRVRGVTNEQINQKLLEQIAEKLGTPSARTRSSSVIEKNLKREVKDMLLTEFEKLQIAFARTTNDEPLLDIETFSDGRRVLYVDSTLIDRWLVELTGSKDKNPWRETAEDALFMAVFFATAAPQPLEEPAASLGTTRVYSLNEQTRDRFLVDVDQIFAFVDKSASGHLSLEFDDARTNRTSQPFLYHLPSNDRQRLLSGPGLKTLETTLKSVPLNYEISDASGKRLKWWTFILRTFEIDGVHKRMAKLLEGDYYLENRLRKLTNERIFFIVLANIPIALLGIAWIVYPHLVPDIWHRTQLSQFILTVFSARETGEPMGYQVVFTGLVGLIASSIFLGIFMQTAQYIAAHFYWVTRGWRRLSGPSSKWKKEFNRLTDFDADEILEFVSKASPLQHESDLRSPLEKYSLMMIDRVERSLDRAPMSTQRLAVSALYAYAKNPLHPDESFFKDLEPLELPSDLLLMEVIGKPARFQASEIKWLLSPRQKPLLDAMARDLGISTVNRDTFKNFSMADTEQALNSLRRHGFPFTEGTPFIVYDNKRRDEMTLRRAKLAIGAMRKSPVHALLALISRDLAGLAFDPKLIKESERDQVDLMSQVLGKYIHRLRTLAPDVYVSYREWSRYSPMGWQFYDAMSAINDPDPSRAAARASDIEDRFSQVLSDVEIDLTKPEMRPLLTPVQRAQIGVLVLILKILHPIAPRLADRVKRKLGFLVLDDPEEQLALALLLKRSRPDDMNAKAVAALRKILDYRILKDLLKVDGPIDEVALHEIVTSRKLHLYRKLSEQLGLDLESYLHDYLVAKNDPTRQNEILLEYVRRLELAPGLQTGLVFQWSRRILKTSVALHEQFSARLAPPGGDRTGPSTYPDYLSLQLLQDEKLKPTVTLAGLEQLHGEASAVIQHIIRLTSPHGPLPYGRRSIFQEAAGDLNLREALRDAQEDAQLAGGNIFHVAISRRGLRYFIADMFSRIASRVILPVADRIHPVFYNQVEHILENSRREQIVIFTYPETKSLELLANDERIKNAIIVVVPNPFLTNFMKVMTFWTVMPAEKQAFLEDVERRQRDQAVIDFTRVIQAKADQRPAILATLAPRYSHSILDRLNTAASSNSSTDKEAAIVRLSQEHGEKVIWDLETEVENLLFDYTSFKLQFEVHPQRYHLDANGQEVDALDDQLPPRGYRTGSITFSEDLSSEGALAGSNGVGLVTDAQRPGLLGRLGQLWNRIRHLQKPYQRSPALDRAA